MLHFGTAIQATIQCLHVNSTCDFGTPKQKKNSIPELIDYIFFKKFLPFELHTWAFITLDCNDPKKQ